jgi:hypothetical protein
VNGGAGPSSAPAPSSAATTSSQQQQNKKKKANPQPHPPSTGKVGARQRKGLFRRSGQGNKRLTIADMIRPVSTIEEQQLFHELYPLYTKGSSSNWQKMAAAWNTRVALALGVQQELGAEGLAIAPKNASQLAAYAKEMARGLVSRSSAQLGQALAGGTSQPTCTGDLVRQVVAHTLKHIGVQQPLAPTGAAALSKGSGLGGKGGSKRCLPCGGHHQATREHRAKCLPYARKFLDSSNKAREKMGLPEWRPEELAPPVSAVFAPRAAAGSNAIGAGAPALTSGTAVPDPIPDALDALAAAAAHVSEEN